MGEERELRRDAEELAEALDAVRGFVGIAHADLMSGQTIVDLSDPARTNLQQAQTRINAALSRFRSRYPKDEQS